MTFPLYATKEGTTKYFERIAKTYPDLKKESWYCKIQGLDFFPSRLGFGTYRVHYQSKEHADALREALLSGINVIDTSSNYGDGASEILVGNVLKELIEVNRIQREEIIIITKAGYIQGKNLKLYMEKNFPEVVKINRDLYHCIHPEFLEVQIELSRKRMGLDTIDVFLLHNPEYYLKVYGDKTQYLKRIEKALQFLEKKREENTIRYYGISSNTFVEHPHHKEHTNLEHILKIAPDGFRVVQFPANLLETGYKEKWYNGKSFLDIAKENHLWNIANRPFNVIYHQKLYRFARLPSEPKTGEDNPEAIMIRLENQLKDLELKFIQQLSDRHFRFDDKHPSPYETIQYYKDRIDDPETIYSFLRSVTIPFQKSVSFLKFSIEDYIRNQNHQEKLLLDIFENYIKILNHTLSFLPQYILYKNHIKMEAVEKQLSKIDPVLKNLPLSLQVIYLLFNDGIDTILAGMRKIPYVRQLQKIFTYSIPEKKIVVREKIHLN